MRESIGSTFLYNIIFLYIIIVFGLLTATLSYYKGFKVNSRILLFINKYSGYNDSSKESIDNYLSSIGYTVSSSNIQLAECANEKRGGKLVAFGSSPYLYCVYYHANDNGNSDRNSTNKDGKPTYYNYSVVSYIYVDLPIVGKFKIPVYSKGERIYNFSDGQEQAGVVS